MGLPIEPQIDTAQAIAGQVTDRLNPELVIAQLVLAEAPAPGFAEGKEHAAARADELLHHQRLPIQARPCTKIANRVKVSACSSGVGRAWASSQ